MRLLAAALVTLLAAVGAAAVSSSVSAAHGARTAGYAYVALGDSFSSGEGVAPYLRDHTDPVTGKPVAGRCDRSTRAYATYVRPPGLPASVYALASGGGRAGADHRYGSDANVRSAGGVSWSFWACSGAQTVHVLPAALGGRGQGAASDARPQLDSARVARADLVTMTIGGTDAGYSEVLFRCALFRCATPAYRAELTRRVDALRPSLEKVVRAVVQRAPRARVLVLGYPQVFPATAKEQACSMLRPFAGEQDMLRALGVRLNATIAAAVAAVARTGADVAFVPVLARFAGHEVCGRKGAWISGIVVSGVGIDPGSFHPNLKGQRDGYAPAVNAALRRR